MQPRSTEDRGTILESTEGIRPRTPAGTLVEPGPPPLRPTVQSPAPALPEVVFRPTMRPPTPRLVLLDDGDQVAGETIRLREAITLIGRTEGEIRISHDPSISARHAEIVREGTARGARWILRDLGSANGTFVRCGRALLRPDRLIVLGSRRLRYRSTDEPENHSGPAHTVLVDTPAAETTAWPALVETAQNAKGREYVINGLDVTIGRPGCGTSIELDDPQLAARHARVFRSATGAWTIEAFPSVNGVWVQVVEVELASPCRFQIGEQRFVFMT